LFSTGWFKELIRA